MNMNVYIYLHLLVFKLLSAKREAYIKNFSSKMDSTYKMRKGKERTWRKCNWNDEDLVKAIDCYNVGYTISNCYNAFNIPRSSLKIHLSGRTKSKKSCSTNNSY